MSPSEDVKTGSGAVCWAQACTQLERLRGWDYILPVVLRR